MNDSICPGCKSNLPTDAKFCLQCGRNLNKSLSTTLRTQIMIYSVSFFLAPFGLAFVIKYLKNGGKEERKIGYIAFAITVFAVGTMIFVGSSFINYQMNLLDGLGL